MQMSAQMAKDHCLSAVQLAQEQSRELLMVLGKDDSAAAAAAHKERVENKQVFPL